MNNQCKIDGNTTLRNNAYLVILDSFLPTGFIGENDTWYGGVFIKAPLPGAQPAPGFGAIKRVSVNVNISTKLITKTYYDNIGNVYTYSTVSNNNNNPKQLFINTTEYDWTNNYVKNYLPVSTPNPYPEIDDILDYTISQLEGGVLPYKIENCSACPTFNVGINDEITCNQTETFLNQTQNNVWVWIAIIVLIVLLIYVIYRSQM